MGDGSEAKPREVLLITHHSSPFTLNIESEMHYVTFLDEVLLAFKAQLSSFFSARLAFAGDVIVVSDHFGPDKSFFKIRVGHARRLRCSGSRRNCPRTHLLLARREVGLQSEQCIARANDTIETR